LDLQDTDVTITFLVPREDDKVINRISKEVNTLNKKKEKDVASVLRYVDNDTICRSVQLLNYFGEKVRSQCGICSVCTSQKSIPSKKESILIAEQILGVLEENNCTSREMVESLNFSESKILNVLHQLMDLEKIGINTKNQYYLN
jgi:ATP-dependent DNA helicase RecQ